MILPKSRVSEILAGKRALSKEQARKLAEMLRVPVEVFLTAALLFKIC